MTDKFELKSSHEVIDTVNVADVESIFQGKPTDPDILTVLMKDGKRLYCDEVCPVNSLQEEPIKIKKGCKYRSICNVTNNDTGNISFVAGKIYLAPEDNTLVSEENGWRCDTSENASNFELVEEPVSGLDNGDMPIERWKQAVAAASNQRNYRSSKGLTETRDDYFVDGVQWADEHPKEEPVSDDLEEAAWMYYDKNKPMLPPEFALQRGFVGFFKAGAMWRYEQMTKDAFVFEDRHNTACALASECLRSHGWFQRERDFNELWRFVSTVKELFSGEFHDIRKVKLIIIKDE